MLLISNARPAHSSNYTCKATNAAATVNYTAYFHVDGLLILYFAWCSIGLCVSESKTSVKLLMYSQYIFVSVPVYWLVRPQDTSVVEGENILLNCSASGDPKPTITWKKASGSGGGDYSPIDYNETDSLHLLSNGSLQIEHAQTIHHGYFLCHAENGIGSGISKVISLTVHGEKKKLVAAPNK